MRRPAALRWKRKVDEHPLARVTGTPKLHEGRLYVPVSSAEEFVAADPKYPCCTFRGSVVALDAASGEVAWKTYVIPDQPKPTRTNKIGTQLYGPSGAAIWSSPTVDEKTGTIYVATGDSYSDPVAATSDAIIALDAKTGTIKWSQQMTSGDAFNLACVGADQTNCPEAKGPDVDFGSPPILVTLASGKRALVAGQKSGVVHAVDPDDKGRRLWSTRIGRGGALGGVEWGSAADGEHIYVPLSDVSFKPREAGSGRAHDADARSGGWWRTVRPSIVGRHAGVARTAARLQRPPELQSGAVGASRGHQRRRVLGIDGRSPARVFDERRPHRLGLQHRAGIHDRQRREGARRID